MHFFIFFFNDTATTEIYTLSLHDALPISERRVISIGVGATRARAGWTDLQPTSDLGALVRVAASFRADHLLLAEAVGLEVDRKSTRLNSSHTVTLYSVFWLQKKSIPRSSV